MAPTQALQDGYEAGMAAFNAHDYARSLELLEPISEGTSIEATLARFYFGQAHLRLGMQRFGESRFAAAATHFRKALDVAPYAGGLCRYLATCYVAQNRHDLAAQELRRELNAEPGDTQTRIRCALLAWKSGRPVEAEHILRTGLNIRPNDPEILYQLGTLVASLDRCDEAVELLRTCLEAAPEHAKAHKRLAQCFGAVERYADALTHLQEAQRFDPDDAMIAMQAGMLAGKVRSPRRPETVAWRPPVLLDLDDAKAVERLSSIIHEDPDFVEAFLSLPLSHVDGEVFAALLAVVRRAIDEKPDHADLRHRCSQVLARLGRLDEAVAQSEQAVTLNPRYVAAMIQLAQLYQGTDRHDDAIDRLQDAIRHGGNYADVHYMLGQLYEARGLVAEARRAYTHALELNTGYAAAREALSALAA